MFYVLVDAIKSHSHWLATISGVQKCRREPAIDPQTHATVTALRRRLMNMKPPQQVEQLLAAMKRFESNAQLVGSVGR